jgi:hypothetical protein
LNQPVADVKDVPGQNSPDLNLAPSLSRKQFYGRIFNQALLSLEEDAQLLEGVSEDGSMANHGPFQVIHGVFLQAEALDPMIVNHRQQIIMVMSVA